MQRVMDQVFENETIVFDGFHFIGCSFINCILIITSGTFDFDRCSYRGSTFYVDPSLSIFDVKQSLYEDADLHSLEESHSLDVVEIQR
ncbi:hypothetical protein [Paenibacillus mendelii]|uniref:Uncharacterized protein n=1 Tax=Paenibacillus mendelii TaxID=206163 RepID=A0ABV6J8T6_9BACL|nr:hypothetical protein [Paenibacillus mendelii]MCQ6560021.1 hypothetical protein [Paenibacillus mendelii]